MYLCAIFTVPHSACFAKRFWSMGRRWPVICNDPLVCFSGVEPSEPVKNLQRPSSAHGH